MPTKLELGLGLVCMVLSGLIGAGIERANYSSTDQVSEGNIAFDYGMIYTGYIVGRLPASVACSFKADDDEDAKATNFIPPDDEGYLQLIKLCKGHENEDKHNVFGDDDDDDSGNGSGQGQGNSSKPGPGHAH